MAEKNKRSYDFKLTINDVEITADLIEKLEEKLGKLMLAELATIDGGGDLVATPLPRSRGIGDGNGGTAGMHIGRSG